MTHKKINKTLKRKPVANRHRKVHKTHGSLFLILWSFVIITASLLVAGFIKHHMPLRIQDKGFSLKIEKVTYDDVGSKPFEAPKGWKFIIVNITVKNNTNKVYNFAPVLQTYMIDNKGNKYTMSPTKLNDPFVAGPISPHDTRQGQLSYLVPVDAKNVTFRFQQ